MAVRRTTEADSVDTRRCGTLTLLCVGYTFGLDETSRRPTWTRARRCPRKHTKRALWGYTHRGRLAWMCCLTVDVKDVYDEMGEKDEERRRRQQQFEAALLTPGCSRTSPDYTHVDYVARRLPCSQLSVAHRSRLRLHRG